MIGWLCWEGRHWRKLTAFEGGKPAGRRRNMKKLPIVKIDKTMGNINWTENGNQIKSCKRLTPWPGAFILRTTAYKSMEDKGMGIL